MNRYKIYQEDWRFGIAPAPRLGSSKTTYRSFYLKRDGFGHPDPRPPYKKRNWYYHKRCEARMVGRAYLNGIIFTLAYDCDLGNFNFPGLQQSTINRCYAKFKDAVMGDNASLGITVAQWRQSFGMVASRAFQLARAARALYRGRFRDFLDILGARPKGIHKGVKRTRSKQAAGLWLEYSFGWSPLAGDIYTAFQQLEEPIPIGSFKESTREIRHMEPFNICDEAIWVSYLTQRADIKMANPNLFLANQLGLVNIGEVIFDGIPFSFVADWFIDCQSWISSFSDWVGLEVKNAAYTRYTKGYLEVRAEQWGGVCIKPFKIAREEWKREEGLLKPFPNVDFLVNIGKSKARAGNALALLTQILSKF